MVHVDGFKPDQVVWEVTRLINRGGMRSMMNTILLILCAMGFAGIVSKMGALDVILKLVLSRVKSTGGMILSTCLACITMAVVTGSVHLTILIPGEIFKSSFKERGLAMKNLSRTLEDSGTVVVPIIPWSSSGAYMAATLGVAVTEFFPWAILCYTSFLFAITWGYTGLFIAKEKGEDQAA
jgi:NhaC family Na+:H+ antiporter